MYDHEPPAFITSPDTPVTIIKGSTDILLIAPHACIRDGEPKDDENTGPITEAVARQIGCSAIINTYFHKPDDEEYPPGCEPKNDEYPHGLEYGNLDLNLIDDAKPELVPGYLAAIRDVVGEPGRPGKTTVIWIHGADDEKAEAVAGKGKYLYPPNEIDAFIGYGQGDEPVTKAKGSRETAEPETVRRFRDALNRNGMKAVITDENATNYRGRSEARMNQWFREQKYPLDQVESIQLEIRKASFRDLHHNIEKTAGILIEALSQEILVPVEQEETEADNDLVDLAYNHLRGIFAKHIHEAMLQAGRYLVRTFYGSYENARDRKKIRKKSLNLLEDRLSIGTGDAPKKTWIYDAVRVSVDDHFFRMEGEAIFRTYGKLGHSQKVLLTHVKDTKKKKELVEKAVEKPQTVEQFRKSIRELNPPKASQPEPKGRFRDWPDPKNKVNICTGCENDCRYCYAKLREMRKGQLKNGEWGQMEVQKSDVEKNRKRYIGIVGFPFTHDIFPSNLDDYLTVLGKLLLSNNEVLIVSKPRLDCIKPICDACRFFKDKILFRFTIGAMDNDILRFWEPNAPTYEERKACLEYAFDSGFRTSVSMEPMLDTAQIEQTIELLRPYVNQDIWLGTMKHIKAMKKSSDERLLVEIAKVEAGQSFKALTAIYGRYKEDPLIKWKTEALNIINAANKKRFDWSKAPITIDTDEKKNVSAPIVISATRRSDIPACYADQFMDSLRQGHIRYNHLGKWNNVSFANTRFIVFWTKNPRPLIQYLDEIDRMGIGYYFLYTINDYEREGLEPGMPALQERIDTFKMLAERIGKERVVWRFDPLILTDKISRQALIDKVGSVMAQLAGHTEKMVFSFLDPGLYNARNKLKAAGYEAKVFSDDEKAYVSWNIAEMAEEHGIQAAACAEPVSLLECGIKPNKCIDDDLIRRVFNKDAELMSFLDSVKGLEHKGQREHCHCGPAYDIGTENTCRNGCVYCYANSSGKAVKNLLKPISRKSGRLAASTQATAIETTPLEVTIHQVNESIKIVNADFHSWCNDNIESETVDLILTDPPYPKKFLYLWDQLAEVAARVLKPNRYLVTYSGQLYFTYVFDALGKHLTFCNLLCLKHNGRNSMVWARRIIATWKPILIFKKGTFDGFDKPINDVITDDKPDKKYHQWGQGEKAFEYLMESFSSPNDLVLEPFAGGGTTLAVANRLGRKCIGIEIDPKFIDVIKERLSTSSILPEAIPIEQG